ncbi:hypothetical protein ACFX15_011212 [Malus domestica]
MLVLGPLLVDCKILTRTTYIICKVIFLSPFGMNSGPGHHVALNLFHTSCSALLDESEATTLWQGSSDIK